MQEPKRKSKSKKLPPYSGEKLPPLVFEGFTEEEINRAFKAWDDAMPDYKGLLDAKVIKKDDNNE